MGLFSSKYETHVGTTVSRVVEDDGLQSSIKTGVLKSLFDKDGGDIPAFIIEDLVASIGLRAERLYDYARREKPYLLPTGSHYAGTNGQEKVQAVLDAIEGQPVLIEYCRFGGPNMLHIGWTRLLALYGWDHTTNQIASLTSAKGTPVWLKDMIVVVPKNKVDSHQYGWAALDQWGMSPKAGYTPTRSSVGAVGAMAGHSKVLADPTNPEEHIRLVYVWIEFGEDFYGRQTQVVKEASVNIPVSGYADEKSFFHVRYSIDGVPKFWMYEHGSGVYPTLDAVFHDAELVGTYFPFIYFRHNKTSTITDKTSDFYKENRKLLKYLGINYVQVAEAIDENPDIGQVEQAMLIFAASANTDDELELRYLYDYFDRQYSELDYKFYTPTQSDITIRQIQNGDIVKNGTIIRDGRFKMALNNGGIYKKRVKGNFGPVGSHEGGRSTFPVEVSYQTVHYSENGDTYSDYTQTVMVKHHFYRRQITEHLYDEIQIVNLQLKYYVFGEYAVTADDDKEILLVPLDRSITRNYSIPDREQLYGRSLHYVFNSRVVQEIKWYQQGWFGDLIKIVGIVFSVVTMGASLVAAAAATMTIQALILAIAMQLLIYVAISVAIKLFIKVVGAEFALLMAVVAAVVAGYQMIVSKSLSGAPWAEDLLKISNNLSQGVSAELERMFAGLQDEAAQFEKYIEEQTKTLETAQELLEGNKWLSPFVIFGETPDEFFNRTVHSGNIGVMGINAISSYVDIALTLPRLEETIGDDDYGEWSI